MATGQPVACFYPTQIQHGLHANLYALNLSCGFGSSASFVVELYGMKNGIQPSSGSAEFFFTHWNELNESIESDACSLLRLNPIERNDFISGLVVHEGDESTSCNPCNNKSLCSSKRASIHSNMDHCKGVIECSIHDSNIENQNRIILAQVKDVVENCHILGISFRENDEDVVELAIKIINKED